MIQYPIDLLQLCFVYRTGSVDYVLIWLLQVNGFAAQYEATGEKDALTAVQHFFDVITHHHSYATGGQPSHTLTESCDTAACDMHSDCFADPANALL